MAPSRTSRCACQMHFFVFDTDARRVEQYIALEMSLDVQLLWGLLLGSLKFDCQFAAGIGLHRLTACARIEKTHITSSRLSSLLGRLGDPGYSFLNQIIGATAVSTAAAITTAAAVATATAVQTAAAFCTGPSSHFLFLAASRVVHVYFIFSGCAAHLDNNSPYPRDD